MMMRYILFICLFIIPVESYAESAITTTIQGQEIKLPPPQGTCFIKNTDSLGVCEQTLPHLQWSNSHEMKVVATFTNNASDKGAFYFGTIQAPDDDKFQAVPRDQFIKGTLKEMAPQTPLKATQDFFQISTKTQEANDPKPIITVVTTTKLGAVPVSIYFTAPYGTENSVSQLQAISETYVTELLKLNSKPQ